MASNPVSIFFSYSRKDEALMRELERHLEPLKLSRLISSWHDGCLTPGEEWEPQIKVHLEGAQIILLLISIDFLNSGYCYSVELTKAIARHKTGDACVIPVILRSCMWQQIPISDMRLGDLQALPKDAEPISKWVDRDEAFTNIAEELFEKIQQLQQKQVQAEYAANLQRYEQAFAKALQAEYPLHLQIIDDLKIFQQQLGLKDEDVTRVEYPLRETAEASYQQVLKELEVTEREQWEASVALQRQAAAAQQIQQEQEATERQRLMAAARQHEQEAAANQKHDELSSERFGANYYIKLHNLLASQDWKAADQETNGRMLEVMNRQENGWLRIEDIQNFPCLDLCNINNLWVQHSQGRFGFSVQKEIWQNCGSPTSYSEDWKKFGNAVGWLTTGSFQQKAHWVSTCDLLFDDKTAPKGHLPSWSWLLGQGPTGSWWWSRVVFFCRIKVCRL